MKVSLDACVNERDALRYLGHKGQDFSEDLACTFRNIVEKVNTLKAAGAVEVFPIERIEADRVLLEGTSFVLPGSNISKHLDGASSAALVAITLGFDSERMLKQSATVSPTEGLIADACASSMAEDAIRRLNEMVRDDAAERGVRCGKRFSPGYGDFPLSAQGGFIKAIAADKVLGIQVTDGDLMMPTKSITAVIPLFSDDEAMD